MAQKPYLSVGEIDGDRIGCYLFGVEATPVSPLSYHSVATSEAELLADCTQFFEGLLAKKERLVSTSIHSARHQQDLKVLQNMIINLPKFIPMYLASSVEEPFLKFGGISIFLRTGVRQREKFQGAYTE